MYFVAYHPVESTYTKYIKCWKNNTEINSYNTELLNNLSFRENSFLNMSLVENDVFIVSDVLPKSKLLKNGTLENFTNEEGAIATDIVIIEN